MTITPLLDFSITALAVRRSGEERTPGLHLSDIIKSIMQELEPRKYGKPGEQQTFDETTLIRFEIGFTFEEALEAAFNARRMDIVRIGEVEKDGIIGSPDGINVATDPPELEEFKSTFKSMRGTPWPCENHREPVAFCGGCSAEWDTRHFAWLLQIKSYCAMLNLNVAVIRALFFNGDYQPAGSPVLRCWRFEFTDDELTAHWAYIVNHAREKGMLK